MTDYRQITAARKGWQSQTCAAWMHSVCVRPLAEMPRGPAVSTTEDPVPPTPVLSEPSLLQDAREGVETRKQGPLRGAASKKSCRSHGPGQVQVGGQLITAALELVSPGLVDPCCWHFGGRSWGHVMRGGIWTLSAVPVHVIDETASHVTGNMLDSHNRVGWALIRAHHSPPPSPPRTRFSQPSLVSR